MDHIESQTANKLLAALPINEFERIVPKLEEVELTFGTKMFDRGKVIEYVHFPTSTVATLLAVASADMTLEIGMVGREGVAGVPVFLGNKVAPYRCVAQTDGTALRMATKDFETECAIGETLREMLLGYARVRMAQTQLASACHRFHNPEKRLVRWTLMTSDRTQNSEIMVTPDFLTDVLGERREAVAKAAKALAERNLIDYSGNRLMIPDRPALENAACNCYTLIRNQEKTLPFVH